MWKMGLGIMLFLMVMGIIGGMLYLSFLAGRPLPEGAGDGTVHLLVKPSADREWYNGTLPAGNATALSVLEEASEEDNLHLVVATTDAGARVQEINARAADPQRGHAWHYWVLRDGAWAWGGGRPPDWMDLRGGDTVVWMYGPTPAEPGEGPDGVSRVALTG